MKNRVLALCLTVALLLGMMPAITLPTRVYAANADVNVNAVFTQETITVDGALNETSWKNVTYADVAKDNVTGKLAVVVNAGDVYVALKGSAASVSAAIGGKSANGTTVNNVTEICVADVTIGTFGAVLEMTLTVDGTAITAAVTFTQKEINLNVASDAGVTVTPDMSTVTYGSTGYGTLNAWATNTNRYYWTITGAKAVRFWGISDRTDRNNGAAFEVDHSKQVIWNQYMTFYPNAMYQSTASAGRENLVVIDEDQKLSANNGMLHRVNDGGENGGFFYVVLYADMGEGTYPCAKARFIMPGSSYGNVIYSDPITLSGGSKEYATLQYLSFQWDPDGSVTIIAKDTVASPATIMSGTVEGVTWTRDTSAAEGTISNPVSIDYVTYDPDGDGVNAQYRTTGDFMDFSWRMADYSGTSAVSFYQRQPNVIHKNAVVAIEDGDYLAEVTVADVVTGNLPSSVDHAYLGALPLTWSDNGAGYVSANGTVTPTLEDKEVILNAMQGDTPVVTNKTVTIKGIDKLAALYTAESMAVNNTLAETSWKYSSWYAFGDNALSGSVAVVINKGVAYVAVKSTATSGTVTLAGKEAALTFENGVAEAAISDLGLTKYENNLTMQVSVTDGDATADAACVAVFTNKAVNLTEGTPLVLKVNGSGSGSTGMLTTTHALYRMWRFSSSTANRYYMLDTVSATDATPSGFSLDHSKEVNMKFNVRFDTPIPDGDGELVTALNDNGATTYGKALTFMLNDSDAENGGFFYAMYYHKTEGDVTTAYMRFMMPSSTVAQPVFSDPIALYTHANSTVFRIGFVWNPDGSVAVVYYGTGASGDGTATVLGKVDGATWKHTGTAGTYKNPKSFAGTTGDYFQHAVSTSSATNITGYFWNDIELTHTETATEVDINDGLSELLIPDEVTSNLPSSVEHTYLGTLPLTWSADVDGIVSENGAIKLPEVDIPNVTLIAYCGSTEIVNKKVTIKAAEKLVALATSENIALDGKLYEVSWRYAAWKDISGDVPGSVAVVMKTGEAYVGIKSATATTVTVTLGEYTIEDVPVVNGVAEIKITNVSIDTLQESFAVAVILSDGTNTSSLEKCETVALNKQKVSDGRTGDILAFVNTAEAGDASSDKKYKAGTHFAASNTQFWANRRLFKGNFYVINSGHGLAWDHNKDIYIEQYLWTNMMPVSDGMFTDTGSTLTSSDGYIVRGEDYVSKAVNHVFWANIYNADEEGNLKVRFLKADRTNSDPIDLGIKVKGSSAQVGFLWSKDGSITVLVDGEVKGVVDNATITTDKAYLAGNNGDRFYPLLQSTSNAYMYVYEVSIQHVNTDAASAVTQRVELGDNIGFIFKGDSVSAAVGENTYTGSEVRVDLAAAQMNDTVAVTVTDGSGLLYTQNYSVRDYALTVLGSDDYADYHDMVKAMLNYGAAAQKHFEYKDDNLVSDDVDMSDLDLENVVMPESQSIVKGGDKIDGITFYGASLIFRNKIVIRYYFEVAEGYDIADYTFTDKAGNPFEVKRDGNSARYFMDVEDINPQQYDEIFTVTVNDTYTISYSCNQYIGRMYAKDSTAASLKDLLKAMYVYGQKANDIA